MKSSESSVVAERQDKNIISYFSDNTTLKFSYGETVINGLDEPTGVYLIKKGFVKSYSTSHDGHSNLLQIHEAGDLIPLPWALDGTNVTGLYYEAMDDVEVIKSSKDKLRITMGNNMWLTQEILNQTVNVIAVYTRRIQILEFRSARGRVIAELILLADRFGELQENKIVIRAPITHQDIADSINMNRETASRALGQLFNEKLVNQIDHLFAIDSMDKLKAALK
jgi:CRP/FNR family transcriptional regulator